MSALSAAHSNRRLTSGAPMEERYIVFRTDDVTFTPSGAILARNPLEPRSFFVLRRQDIFAANVLEMYAGQIVNLVEACDLVQRPLPEFTVKYLARVADGVMELANEWMDSPRKVPDP
jgi:hypothetical protein